MLCWWGRRELQPTHKPQQEQRETKLLQALRVRKVVYTSALGTDWTQTCRNLNTVDMEAPHHVHRDHLGSATCMGSYSTQTYSVNGFWGLRLTQAKVVLSPLTQKQQNKLNFDEMLRMVKMTQNVTLYATFVSAPWYMHSFKRQTSLYLPIDNKRPPLSVSLISRKKIGILKFQCIAY